MAATAACGDSPVVDEGLLYPANFNLLGGNEIALT